MSLQPWRSTSLVAEQDRLKVQMAKNNNKTTRVAQKSSLAPRDPNLIHWSAFEGNGSENVYKIVLFFSCLFLKLYVCAHVYVG